MRWQQRFSNYCKALAQLEAFLDPPGLNEREQQGLLKAFETTFELAWNTLHEDLQRRARANKRSLYLALACREAATLLTADHKLQTLASQVLP